MPSTRSSATADADSSPPPRGRRLLLVAIVVAVVLVVAGVTIAVLAGSSETTPTPRANGGVSSGVTRVDPGAVEVGQPVPDFEVVGLDGEQIRLSDFRGHPVLVNFWASWCHPCRDEFPLLAKALTTHRADGLEVVGVSYEDIASDARDFADEQDATWPLGKDTRDGVIAKAFGVSRVPQTFFIDADGVLRARIFGMTKRVLNENLETILP